MQGSDKIPAIEAIRQWRDMADVGIDTHMAIERMIQAMGVPQYALQPEDPVSKMKRQLGNNPSDWETRMVYADALDDADDAEMATLHRVLAFLWKAVEDAGGPDCSDYPGKLLAAISAVDGIIEPPGQKASALRTLFETIRKANDKLDALSYAMSSPIVSGRLDT